MSRRPTWEDLARQPDDAIDVALGAALVARDVYENLDVEDVVGRVAGLAGPLRGKDLDGSGLTPASKAEAVSRRFRDLGFHGNVEDYYDPRNSLLSDVLDRKVGIPITLSVVWCEIARGAGLSAHGVSFPGHFLVRVGPDADRAVVDPFGGGRLVDDDAAVELLRRSMGSSARKEDLHPSLFAAASPRTVLVRMLTNLKTVWAHRGDHARAFVAVDRIVTLLPDSPRMLRERAGVALRLGITELAHADLARVVELEPDAPDVGHIKKRLAELEGSARIVN
jgi:regulator of sirC expression with transglutaminase-like and TPR domain